jgi:hypothetical protein
MANHVYTIMCITSTPEVLKAFKDKIVTEQKQTDNTDKDKDSVLPKWYDECYRLADNLYELIYGEEYPEEPDRDWMITNIGAKWCHLHDWQFDEDEIILTFESAWDTPEELFYMIADYFQDNSKEFEIELTSEDEALLHIAGGYANQFGSDFICEYDEDNIPKHPILDNYDEENEEYYEADEQFYLDLADAKQKLVNLCKEDLIVI